MSETSSKLKKYFVEWCEVTTCAGVIDWYLAKSIHGKLFWTVLLLVGISLTSWQTFLLFQQFATDNPFQTTLTVQSDEILFPNVTLCNINRINRKLLGEFENDTEMLSYALVPSSINYFRWAKFSQEQVVILEERWSKFKNSLNISDLKNMFQRFGSDCHEIFIECRWAYAKFDCCKYASEAVASFGRCWTIQYFEDPQTIAVQRKSGIYFGLQIILNPNLDQYVKNLVFNNFLEEGFFLDIGYVQLSYIDNFIVLQPGYHSWIAMKAIKQTTQFSNFQLFKPKCRPFQKFKYITSGYTQLNCLEECEAGIILDLCNCLQFTLTQPGFPICTTLQMINCALIVYNNNTKAVKRRDECSKLCLPPCDPYWTIQKSQTSTKFIGDHLREKFNEILKNESNITGNTNSLISLNVFFETLDYTEVQLSEANPIFVFIGNIGGQLSMWLGISIVTIIQAWYYVILCCCQKRQGKTNAIVVKSKLND